MAFPKCCQVKFNIVVVTCTSTLTLPWQPSFDNHICLFFYVKTSYFNYTFHLTQFSIILFNFFFNLFLFLVFFFKLFTASSVNIVE